MLAEVKERVRKAPIEGLLMIIGAAGMLAVVLWQGLAPSTGTIPKRPDPELIPRYLQGLTIHLNVPNMLFLGCGILVVLGPLLAAIRGWGFRR